MLMGEQTFGVQVEDRILVGGELVFEMDGKIEARWALARANAKR